MVRNSCIYTYFVVKTQNSFSDCKITEPRIMKAEKCYSTLWKFWKFEVDFLQYLTVRCVFPNLLWYIMYMSLITMYLNILMQKITMFDVRALLAQTYTWYIKGVCFLTCKLKLFEVFLFFVQVTKAVEVWFCVKVKSSTVNSAQLCCQLCSKNSILCFNSAQLCKTAEFMHSWNTVEQTWAELKHSWLTCRVNYPGVLSIAADIIIICWSLWLIPVTPNIPKTKSQRQFAPSPASNHLI